MARVTTGQELEVFYREIGEVVISDDLGHAAFADMTEAPVQVIDAFSQDLGMC